MWMKSWYNYLVIDVTDQDVPSAAQIKSAAVDTQLVRNNIRLNPTIIISNIRCVDFGIYS